MIKSNLQMLLAQRRLKITQVAQDTGISRTTLTSLYYQHAQGLQLDTINKLCQYLNVTPGDLFIYAPFDYEINVTFGDLYEIESGTPVLVEVHITQKRRTTTYSLSGEVNAEIGHDDEDPASDEIKSLTFYLEHHSDENEDKPRETLEDAVSMMPDDVRSAIDFDIADELASEIQIESRIHISSEAGFTTELPWTSIYG